jgi:hypothetical protein
MTVPPVLHVGRPETMVRRIPGLLAYLVHVDSLLAIGVLAVLVSLLEWVGTLPGAFTALANGLARAVWCCYFYLVARKAAAGKLRLPVPTDYRDTAETLVKPLVGVTFATSWYWILLLGCALVTIDLAEFLGRHQAHPLIFLRQQGTVGYLLLAVGMIYLPVAVVGSLVGAHRVLALLDPLHGFRLIRRVPRAFSIMFVILSVLAVVGFTLEALGNRLVGALPIPLAAPVIRHLMRLWVPLAQSRLVGEFVFYNRAFLERGDSDGR